MPITPLLFFFMKEDYQTRLRRLSNTIENRTIIMIKSNICDDLGKFDHQTLESKLLILNPFLVRQLAVLFTYL